MRRRTFLAGIAATSGLASLAGCAGVFQSERSQTTTTTVSNADTVTNPPDAVYYPSHIEGMVMVGMASDGDYRCALTFSFPHRFWLVTGQRRKVVERQPADTMHLMPVVWDAKTGMVPPDLNPQVTLSKDGEQVTTLSPWPMLSQPMGFHFGDNIQLPGKGTYQVDVRTGSPTTRRTGSLADAQEPASFSFELDYTNFTMDDIKVMEVPQDKQGTRGAVDPMGMKKMPTTQVPKPNALPGTVREQATSGDAKFVATTLTDATRFGGSSDQTYLAVSPRTPYNRYMLPLMSLSGTLERDGTAVYDGILQSTLDPDVGYHYGAAVPSVQSGDELTITVDAPPQTARHKGYETTFFEMPAMTLTL